MEKKQQEIIDTSAVLFSVAGIKKTSVDLICSKCGISKKTLYQYFDHKEAIVDEIVKKCPFRNKGLHKTHCSEIS